MTEEQTAPAPADAPSAPDAAPAAPRPTRAARGARPAAPALAPADETLASDGRQILKPASILTNSVIVPADGEHPEVEIPKTGLEVDAAEADRLFAAAGSALRAQPAG